ncbi:glycerophosphodiester phosphodiesterase family protein [Allonocardiopsis opalescens]|nr:glycerophosphodiester phosphodiesterase family protein [Allonocardiopsis opalescens]
MAHRGGTVTEPDGTVRPGLENTMRAFQHAADLGYRYVETDVHATADGVLLACHDATLDRTADRPGAIAELTAAQVARARVAGTEPVPTLEQLLGELPQLRVNIDIKAPGAVAPLADALRRTRAHDRVCVGSFSQRRMRRLRRLLDRPVCTSAAPADVARLRLAAYTPWPALYSLLAALAGQGVPCAQIPLAWTLPAVGEVPLVTPELLRTARALGIAVHVWTINDPALMRRLLDLGVDGIVTDNTPALKEVLMRRDQWIQGAPQR